MKSQRLVVLLSVATAMVFYLYATSILLKNDILQANKLERIEVEREASILRANIEAQFNNSFFLVSGLVTSISNNPDITREEFELLASDMVERYPFILNVAPAPDLKIKYAYPFEPNKAAIGLDYRKNDAQREAAFRTRDSGKPVIAGPLNFVQGGTGFIARYPVFIKNNPTGYVTHDGDDFWGLISIVIEKETFYRESGIANPDSPLEIAIRGTDGLGAAGQHFHGNPELFNSEIVATMVTLPGGGTWLLAARPKDGWIENAPHAWLIYSAITFVFLTIVSGIIFAARYLEKVQEAKMYATSASEAKSRFIANMSHELRTPLNAISGFQSLLKTENLTDKQSEYLSYAQQATDGMTSLISKVLDVALIDSGKLNLSPQRCVLKDELDGALSRYQHQAEAKNLKFHTEYSSGLSSDEITVDSVRVRDIICVLLENAVSFTDCGDITFFACREGLSNQLLKIQVIDTGPGISQAESAAIFDHFSQIDDSRTRTHSGTGIGLSFARKLAKYMGGDLSYTAPKGGGSIFTLTLNLNRQRDFASAKTGDWL